MQDEQIQRIVTEVIRKVAVKIGADGSRGTIIAIFTAATVEFREAVSQIRRLSLDGYRVQLVFSENAENLYGKVVRAQLEGFPHIETVAPSRWYIILKKACALIVPLLSMNTVSKISLLIADNLATNLILHAFFMGIPVFAAQNGARPEGSHWGQKIGSFPQSPALGQAVIDRLGKIVDYGCILTDIYQLRHTVNSFLDKNKGIKKKDSENTQGKSRTVIDPGEKIITAARVHRAYLQDTDLILPPGSLVTPLARDMALKYQVALVQTDGE